MRFHRNCSQKSLNMEDDDKDIVFGVGVEMKIKHCYNCKDGRLIKHGAMVFCGFCGKEFNISKVKI